MATTRKSTGRKSGAKKPTGSITKAKAKRVARKAQAVLEGAAHDAGLALRRTAGKLKRTAKTKLEEAKGPAKRTARRVERKVASALESAGDSITTAGHRAKRSFDAAKKAFAEAPAAKKPGVRRKKAS